MKVLAFIQVNNQQTQPSSIIVTWHARTNLIGSCRSLHMKNKPHWLSLIKQAYLSIVVKSECCIVFWLIIQYMQINSIIKIGQISSEALDQTIQFRYTRIPLKKQKPFIYIWEREMANPFLLDSHEQTMTGFKFLVELIVWYSGVCVLALASQCFPLCNHFQITVVQFWVVKKKISLTGHASTNEDFIYFLFHLNPQVD